MSAWSNFTFKSTCGDHTDKPWVQSLLAMSALELVNFYHGEDGPLHNREPEIMRRLEHDSVFRSGDSDLDIHTKAAIQLLQSINHFIPAKP